MQSLFRYLADPSPCGYLPDQVWQLEYEHVVRLSPAEYQRRLLEGWRRFGMVLFRPRCSACTACRSLRVLVGRFHPDRSQRRARKTNEGAVELRIGRPTVSAARLALYDRYHAFQSATKGWPVHEAKDPADYAGSFVHNPFATEEWCYYLDRRLIGVGYVDVVPEGLSAIYFFYDPRDRQRSPGTWNVLCLLQEAAARRLPHVYLGYYVDGSPSMAYKSGFKPNQILGCDGRWRDFKVK
jgi:leucyl-tRNA---protein transferase